MKKSVENTDKLTSLICVDWNVTNAICLTIQCINDTRLDEHWTTHIKCNSQYPSVLCEQKQHLTKDFYVLTSGGILVPDLLILSSMLHLLIVYFFTFFNHLCPKRIIVPVLLHW